MKERISGLKDKVEETDRSVKKKCYNWKKKIQVQNIQEVQDVTKRQNLWILGIEAVEETQIKGTENIFDKIKDEISPA